MKDDAGINMNAIANKAGVSIATVSNVINGKGRVSEKTIKKVNKIIKELNYAPNMIARNLKTRKSRLIGAVVPIKKPGRLRDNPFYWDLVSGIEEGVRDGEFHVLLTGIDEDKEIFTFVKERQLDGLIVVGASENSNVVQRILDLGTPCVFMDSYLSDSNIYQVYVDDRMGGYIGTKHLIDQSHKKIAVLMGDIEEEDIRMNGVLFERWKGYKKALEEQGLNYDPELILKYPTSLEGGYEAAGDILKRSDLTAVFSFSDVSAMGLLRGLKENGLQVPQDISVVGFDDLFLSGYTSPPLTTVHQDIVLKGRKAAQLLLDQIEDKTTISERKVVLPVHLSVRETTSRAN